MTASHSSSVSLIANSRDSASRRQRSRYIAGTTPTLPMCTPSSGSATIKWFTWIFSSDSSNGFSSPAPRRPCSTPPPKRSVQSARMSCAAPEPACARSPRRDDGFAPSVLEPRLRRCRLLGDSASGGGGVATPDAAEALSLLLLSPAADTTDDSSALSTCAAAALTASNVAVGAGPPMGIGSDAGGRAPAAASSCVRSGDDVHRRGIVACWGGRRGGVPPTSPKPWRDSEPKPDRSTKSAGGAVGVAPPAPPAALELPRRPSPAGESLAARVRFFAASAASTAPSSGAPFFSVIHAGADPRMSGTSVDSLSPLEPSAADSVGVKSTQFRPTRGGRGASVGLTAPAVAVPASALESESLSSSVSDLVVLPLRLLRSLSSSLSPVSLSPSSGAAAISCTNSVPCTTPPGAYMTMSRRMIWSSIA
mmetsp:Transcript_4237/g.15628  ORF Transcript_4237/g.15628 Transcript_4237/m.15628 type:complete len:422 (-) Transcript_4237:1962-3227(-)